MKKIIFFVMTATSIVACQTPSTTGAANTNSNELDSAKLQIAEMNKTYGDGFAKGDSSLFLNHYTKDACVMPPQAPKLCGAQGVGGFFNAAKNLMGVRNITVVADEITGGPTEVVEVGQYELFGDSAKTKSLDKGKYIVVWKEEDGKWKMHRDIFNTSNAPAAPIK
jgi:ketosteroid isomerase-like protein